MAEFVTGFGLEWYREQLAYGNLAKAISHVKATVLE